MVKLTVKTTCTKFYQRYLCTFFRNFLITTENKMSQKQNRNNMPYYNIINSIILLSDWIMGHIFGCKPGVEVMGRLF